MRLSKQKVAIMSRNSHSNRYCERLREVTFPSDSEASECLAAFANSSLMAASTLCGAMKYFMRAFVVSMMRNGNALKSSRELPFRCKPPVGVWPSVQFNSGEMLSGEVQQLRGACE
jgi:hypothetical protein